MGKGFSVCAANVCNKVQSNMYSLGGIFLQRPISIHFWFLFALVLALAAGLTWFVLEGAESALLAASATLIAALPLPYAMSCLLADRAVHRALKKNQAHAADPNALALLKDIDTVLLPRRPFLIGEPHIKELMPEGLSQSDLLALAASAEQDASHPYAKIICAIASDRHLRLHRLSAVTETPHAGVEALLMGQALRVGRLDWLEDEGVKTSAELLTRADQLALHGLALVGVALGPRMRGLIAFEEDVSETAKKPISAFERAGIQTTLLTHGSRRFANATGKALGTSEARSLTKTDSLVRELQLYKAKGHVVASLVDAMSSTADLTIHLTSHTNAAPSDASSQSKKTEDAASRLVLPSLAALPALIAGLQSTSRALRSCFRLSLAAFVLLTLPSFGLLHAIGGPFLPPAAAALGLVIFTIATIVRFFTKSA